MAPNGHKHYVTSVSGFRLKYDSENAYCVVRCYVNYLSSVLLRNKNTFVESVYWNVNFLTSSLYSLLQDQYEGVTSPVAGLHSVHVEEVTTVVYVRLASILRYLDEHCETKSVNINCTYGKKSSER